MTLKVYYHHPCNDGTGALYAAEEHFKDAALYSPFDYSKYDPTNELLNSVLYFVDCAPRSDQLAYLLAKNITVTVIDHHPTALAGIGDVEHHNFKFHYDQQKSGAGLTWDLLNEKPRPWFIDLIEDRDLFRFSIPGSEEFYSLLSCNLNTGFLRSLEKEDKQEVLKRAQGFHEYHVSLCEDIAANAPVFGKYALFNCHPRLVSDSSKILLSKKYKLAVSYYIHASAVRLSFRSSDGSARKLAERMGGGGHDNASGATVSMADFQRLKVLFEHYFCLEDLNTLMEEVPNVRNRK